MKYYQPLILSLLFHLFFWKGLVLLPQSSPTSTTSVEIIYDDKEDRKKIITHHKVDHLIKKLEQQSKHLSKLTRRVKRELIANKTGLTQNRRRVGFQPKFKSQKKNKQTKGKGRVREKPLTKNLYTGLSTISEYIPGVERGNFTALNSDQFTYYSFFSRVNEQLRPRWIRNIRDYSEILTTPKLNRLARRPRLTRMEIIINKNGHFIDHIIHHRSGFDELDNAALAAFKQSSPLVNPPQEMLEEDGYIHLYYSFRIEWRPRGLAKGHK